MRVAVSRGDQCAAFLDYQSIGVDAITATRRADRPGLQHLLVALGSDNVIELSGSGDGRSQPWPYSGSIMVGFTATTDDEHPTMPTDGELSETRWVTRDELLNNTLPLPGPGSLAANLIHEWLHQ